MPAVITPPAALSTSGDYATDVLGDPWDFKEQGDVPPYMTLGTEAATDLVGSCRTIEPRAATADPSSSSSATSAPCCHGVTTVCSTPSTQRLQQALLQGDFSTNRQVGIRFWTEAGFIGTAFLHHLVGARCGTVRVRPRRRTGWSGKIVRSIC
jgi:hypothetical protein